jgi:hypothetical protein
MEIKDQATAIEAALNLDRPGSEPTPKPGEPAAPRKLSTSQRLFPENITDDGLIVNRPVTPFVDKDKALPSVGATPAPVSAPATPTPPAPTAPGELDLSKMPDGTMVRIKVDGVEMTVPAKEALKNIQLERHLTQKSQELARERAALEAERAALRNQPPAPSKPPEAPATPPVPAKGSLEAERIASLERQIQQMAADLAPQRFQAGLNRLAERAKQEFGATDFNEYVPKIKEFVDGELAKPEVAASPAALKALDSAEFWYSKYRDMKLRDVLSGAKPAAPVLTPASIVPSGPVVEAPAGTHLVLDKNNRPVVVPIVEGSTGVPSRVSPDQDWQARYQAAFEVAKKTGRTEDWQTVFRLKRETPGE